MSKADVNPPLNLSDEPVLEGIFAIAKPSGVSSADTLLKLQVSFANSQTFAPLRSSQVQRPSKSDDRVFKMGHGGTLDPLASGVLIIGIGRGTKFLSDYLACTKTYETTVVFGCSTDSYDCTGAVTDRVTSCEDVTRAQVEAALGRFVGRIWQTPPAISALKINGVKACAYVRAGQDLPRPLEAREMQVDECVLKEWYEPGMYPAMIGGSQMSSDDMVAGPSVRIRLTVSSGFYVRSFAHDLGLACGSLSYMASLVRLRQASFSAEDGHRSAGLQEALTFEDLEGGEDVWAPKLKPQLEEWVRSHPRRVGNEHKTKRELIEEKNARPAQRFRGEWVASTKQERIKQQGGKFKGKWSKLSKDHRTALARGLQDSNKQADAAEVGS